MQRAARDLGGALAIWLCLAPLVAAQYSYYQPIAPPTTPYEAWLADGTRIAGTRLAGGWFKNAIDLPKLDEQVLKLHGRPENPLRLLRQQAVATPRLSPPYIELANGDILPGRVISAESAGPDAEDVRLTVSVDTTLTAGGFSTGRVTLRASWVARIIGSPRALASAPANVALGLDGEHIPYRSFRWMPEGVRLLTDKGVQVVPFGSLGQIVPPGVDRIAALLAEAAQANAEGASFLMRAITRQGAVLTSTRTECELQKRVTRGGFRDYRTPQPDIQIEYLQPAWALNTLSVNVNDVLLRGFRTPHDIPLSLLPLETVEQRSLVGVPHTRAPNAAGDGGWLTAGDRVGDLGLSVRSRTVLRATLPPGAKTLSGWVGLDRSVGTGGCIVAEIYDGVPNGNPLWSSGFLQGKDGPRRIEALPIDDLSHVTLVTDFGHEGRPAGADALDIRDEATWLAPMVEVDDEVLEAQPRWRGLVPGWQGWTLPEEMPRELLLTTRFTTFDGRWESVVTIGEESPLVLKRRVQVGAYASDILELQIAAISLPGYSDASRLHRCELRIGDAVLQPVVNSEKLRQPEETLRMQAGRRGFPYPPQVNPMGTISLWWDLQEYRGREVELVLTVRRPAQGEMLWRDLRFRSAVASLRSGQPIQPDVPLSSVKPLGRFASGQVEADALPGQAGPLTLVGQRFRSGYGMRLESKVEFPISPDFKRFVALVGAAANRAGPFRVLIDGQQVWSHGTVESIAGAREVVVDIPAGAKVLTLESGPDGSYLGFTVWANAGFTTK